MELDNTTPIEQREAFNAAAFVAENRRKLKRLACLAVETIALSAFITFICTVDLNVIF